MTAWLDELRTVIASGEDACIVTVAAVRGSAPREAGAKMIVTARHSYSTIGGGELEYQCTRLACTRLACTRLGEEDAGEPRLRKFTLGANCGQCCGGVVEVLFERIPASGAAWLDKLASLHAARTDAVLVTETGGRGKTIVTASDCKSFDTHCMPGQPVIERAREALRGGAGFVAVNNDDATGRRYMIEPVTSSDFHVAVFGAGHVGTATVSALANLDCNIRWVDSRRKIFPSLRLPNVIAIEAEQPALEVAAMPPGSYFLVMTHSHALDFDICDKVLRREDSAYCGLIGSKSKKRRFERLMRQQKMPEALVTQLTCPIGIDGITGKRPEEIAISVSAQLLQLRSDSKLAQGCDEANVHYFNAKQAR